MKNNKLPTKKMRSGFWKKIALPASILSVFVFGMLFWWQSPSTTPTEKIENGSREETKEKPEPKKDAFVQIDTLSLSESATKLYGTTTSKSQVSVFAEIPAKITRIYAELGDYVNAGDVIITLDDENERNNLTQAQLALTSAELGLEKTLSGAQQEDKTIAQLDIQIKKDALKKTTDDVEKEVSDLEIFLDAVLHNDIDDYFDHTDHDGLIYKPTFTFRLDNKFEDILEQERVDLETTWNNFTANSSDYSLNEKIEQSQNITQTFSDFTKRLYKDFAEVDGIDNERKEELRNSILTIKESIDAKNTLIDTLKNQLVNQQSSLAIAETNFAKINAPAREEDINIAQASINSSKNSIASAQDALNKKTLRAPISGKISEMSADVGKLASSASPIFAIHNPDNLKVLAAIPAEQRNNVSVGEKISIENLNAKISAISPVVDAETGMVNFEATFIDSPKNLLSGTAVEITLPAKKQTKNEKYTRLPLSSVFELSGKYFVFLLNEKLQAEKKEVSFVQVSDTSIVVENTFTGSEQLIINARGISEGDEL